MTVMEWYLVSKTHMVIIAPTLGTLVFVWPELVTMVNFKVSLWSFESWLCLTFVGCFCLCFCSKEQSWSFDLSLGTCCSGTLIPALLPSFCVFGILSSQKCISCLWKVLHVRSASDMCQISAGLLHGLSDLVCSLLNNLWWYLRIIPSTWGGRSSMLELLENDASFIAELASEHEMWVFNSLLVCKSYLSVVSYAV